MNKFMVFSFLFVLATSCDNGSMEVDDSRSKMLSSIHSEEAKLIENIEQPINYQTAKELITLYNGFISLFPKDSVSEEFMFKKAEILMNINQSKEAILVLDTLINNYSESKLIPVALHLKGFIWDDKLNSSEMARICFEQLISEYPDHQLSQNAKDYLTVLGMSPEEIIKQFEEKQGN